MRGPSIEGFVWAAGAEQRDHIAADLFARRPERGGEDCPGGHTGAGVPVPLCQGDQHNATSLPSKSFLLSCEQS